MNYWLLKQQSKMAIKVLNILQIDHLNFNYNKTSADLNSLVLKKR